MKKVKRKLATILAADCVDFSRHMESREEETLENLNACRKIIDAFIDEYGGRIFHTAGDSVIAEFDSPVECVNSAIKFQEALKNRNMEIESEPKLVWRVGIHVDDIIVEGSNVYGTGVNVAARLESKCEPGKILVSRVVREQVSKRISFSIISDGIRELKNISDEFEVFSVSFEGENAKSSERAQIIDTKDQQDSTLIKKPIIAVLPFLNSSKSNDSEFLVDGIVEDLITEFSMISEFDVISRQTSSNYSFKDSDPLGFAKEFNIDFLVGGSIRSSGKRIRINTELTNANDGSVIWSNKFDRILEDIFDVQDEIVRKISISILGEIEITSLQRSKRKPTNNINSYELLLRGKEQHHLFQKGANIKALEYFNSAINLDETNSLAHAWKACTLGQGMARNFYDRKPTEVFAEAKIHLNKALELNENDFECHRMFSAVYLSNHDYKKSEDHGSRAYDINPNDPRVLAGYGEILVRNGKLDQGLEYLNKSLAIDPIPMGQSNSDNRYRDLTLGYFCKSDYKNCESWASKISEIEPRSWIMLMFSMAHLGKDIEQNSIFLEKKLEFSSLDWVNTIDRFHLPDSKKNEQLEKFVEKLFG